MRSEHFNFGDARYHIEITENLLKDIGGPVEYHCLFLLES